jgi:hypothetical protein
MNETVLGEVAAAARTQFATIAGATAYDYEPAAEGLALPAITVDGPAQVTRTSPEGAEIQLGAVAWDITWTVRLYVDLAPDKQTATAALRSLLGAAISAIDAHRDLEIPALVADASLARSSFTEIDKDETHHRELLMFECELATRVVLIT